MTGSYSSTVTLALDARVQVLWGKSARCLATMDGRVKPGHDGWDCGPRGVRGWRA